jgi:integrase/recombinase XerC
MPRQRTPQVTELIKSTQQMLPLRPVRPPVAEVRWSPAGLLADWLHTRQSPKTARVYQDDFNSLATFLECDPEQAAAALLQGRAVAEQILEHWDKWQRDVRGLSPNSRARRIWAAQSFVRHAARREVITYSVSVKVPKLITRRDTSGPDHRKLDLLLLDLACGDDTKSIRDAAIIGLMYCCGLRRGEVLTMRMRDCDTDRQRLMIVAKGRLALVPKRDLQGRLIVPGAQEPDREVLEGVPKSVWRLLRRWAAEVRKQRPEIRRDAPLWWSLVGNGHRLHLRMGPGGLADMLRARLKGARLRPCTTHGMRPAGITKALDASGGDLRLVQAYARHADLRQLHRYDDARRELFAKGAKLVASGLE